MSIISHLKKNFYPHFALIRIKILRLNLKLFYRDKINKIIKAYKPKSLTSEEQQQIKRFFFQKGYTSVKLDWHRFYTASNGHFSVRYIPEDLFHAKIAIMLNQMRQWPSLLDKNLSEILFADVKQPVVIIKNVNEFYYKNGMQLKAEDAISSCLKEDKFIIKPTIETGGGTGVQLYMTSQKNRDDIKHLFNTYNDKDFIVQKVVDQHSEMRKLNPSSLNTLRICSYLNESGVHIFSAIVRVGKANNFTDNCASGGIACGIDNEGRIKEFGYLKYGQQRHTTDSGILLKGFKIPAYFKAIECIKKIHHKVPYFRIISWDIAIDNEQDPVFIEYNVYRQDISIMQLANGPLFGNFTDEILSIGNNNLA